MAAGRSKERNAWDAWIPSARDRASAQSPPLLLLLLGAVDGSGVYRCSGRQLGVLRFALRETVAFLRLSPRLSL